MPYQIIVLAYIAKMDWERVKNYLIACEYLQMDPSKVYDVDTIRQRMENVLSQWGHGDDPDDVREIRTILEKHLKMMGAGPDVPDRPGINDAVRLYQPGTGPHAFQVKTFWGASKPPGSYTATVPELFAKRCSNLIREGKLEILPGTVNEVYVKKGLRQDNFDNYVSKKPKWPN